MEIILIAAIAENGVIGRNNQLIWKLSNDLKRFKELTSGHPVIMGRKTFESLGNKPLKDRLNIVLTSQNSISSGYENLLFCNSAEDALEIAKKCDCKVFIIGGSQIYKTFMPLASRLEITWVKANIQGDAFFPVFKIDKWNKVYQACFNKDEKNEYDYCFASYILNK